MPRLPIDYSKTIIYKIVCNDLNITDVYVGSTTDFTRRKNEHKRCCTNEKTKSYNLKVYQTIRGNGGWNNFTMVEIEKYSCIDSNEAHARERYYLELLNAKLNIQIPTRTHKEYCETNKNQLTEYNKEYRKVNKEQIAEQKKEYRKANKEQIVEYKKQYRETNKEKITDYYQNNKEHIKDYQKKYDEANKEKIAEYKKKYREANKEKIAEQKKQQYLKKKALKEITVI
jgi:hypothetical protein